MRRLLLTIAFVSSLTHTVGLSAQATRIAGERTDTAYFRGDTIFIHSATDRSALSREFARYVQSMRALPGLPKAATPRAMHIYLASDEGAFRALTRGGAPHWGAGIAMPDSGIIVLPAYSSERTSVESLGPVVRHEIAHIALQQSLEGLRIPRWFTEGYAVWSAGQLDPDAAWHLRIAFLTDRAPSLDSLALDWPRGELDARVAYLLSASAVAYLYELGPPESFNAFLEKWRQSGSLEEALRATYLISGTQFERLWSAHVRKNYGWLLFIAQGAVVWLFITIIAIVLIILRRRRDRRRLADLRHSEPPDSPAYWLGEEEHADGAGDEAPADGLTGEHGSDKLAT